MSGSGWETLPDVREWSRGPPRCSGVVGRPPGCAGVVRGIPKCPVVVAKPSRMSGCGREAFPDVQKWSGDHSGCPGMVGRPSR